MTVSVLFQHTSLGWLVWAVVGGGIMMDGKLFSIHSDERKNQPELSKVRIPSANSESEGYRVLLYFLSTPYLES